jgi:hypothetical protein
MSGLNGLVLEELGKRGALHHRASFKYRDPVQWQLMVNCDPCHPRMLSAGGKCHRIPEKMLKSHARPAKNSSIKPQALRFLLSFTRAALPAFQQSRANARHHPCRLTEFMLPNADDSPTFFSQGERHKAVACCVAGQLLEPECSVVRR